MSTLGGAELTLDKWPGKSAHKTSEDRNLQCFNVFVYVTIWKIKKCLDAQNEVVQNHRQAPDMCTFPFFSSSPSVLIKSIPQHACMRRLHAFRLDTTCPSTNIPPGAGIPGLSRGGHIRPGSALRRRPDEWQHIGEVVNL